MVQISKIAVIAIKLGDMAHKNLKKWHVVRIIGSVSSTGCWIPWPIGLIPISLGRNRKVELKNPNEREQQDFDSIEATKNKILESNIDTIWPPEKNARLNL